MKPARLWFVSLLLAAVVAASSCSDPSPVEGNRPTATFAKGGLKASTSLFYCPQSYDSVSQVIGPWGGVIAVGPHYLWVDSQVLIDTVRITAVAPADTVRWVHVQPAGLLFPANPTHGYPTGAALYTNYKDCPSVPNQTLRIALWDELLGILAYLEPVSGRKKPWGPSGLYASGWLAHFSNYALAW